MVERAYSKINLSLNITGVREDGYHTLESIFLPINFYDLIHFDYDTEMSYVCDRKHLLFDETNTVVKAVNLMKSEYDIKDNFKITIKKQVPSSAGLGGGSSDGAAIIRFFNKNYSLNLNSERIKELCMKIGSDVLFTYYNKPALISGVGDEIEFIDLKNKYYVVILKPKKGVSTKKCYELLDLNKCIHPDIESLKNALINGDDITPYLGNSMEETAISLLYNVQLAKDLLLNNGAKNVLMSGSGSSVFAISEDKEEIENIFNKILGTKKYYVRYAEIIK